jgi:hypothetical protein
MAIGNQNINGKEITYGDLKKKYDDLIKEAILRARPGLEVTRADDVSLPGTITTDIITRIMHSDIVIADVSYPNPNVFYELGLRHACRPGTIIIKDKDAPAVPFDIAHLRHLEYTNTPSGLKELCGKLDQYFDFFEKNPDRPDNHLLEYAKLTHYQYPDYSEVSSLPPEVELLQGMMESPELLEMIIRQGSGEVVDQSEVIRAFMTNPKVAMPLITAMTQSGEISLFDGPKQQSSKSAPKKRRS